MGGERASAMRQRENGIVCCRCRYRLDPPPRGHRPGYSGERFCPRCDPGVRCAMRFERVLGTWRVTVTDNRGKVVRECRFADAAKVREMADRGGAFRALADKQAVDYGLRQGLGRCELHLSTDQWITLTSR